jgi:hypothetical protein
MLRLRAVAALMQHSAEDFALHTFALAASAQCSAAHSH